ncbi:MAG: hypothetical protein M3081_08615 [Gemmatimonadota bacterium]|nr:hypothetical protein [Gemmatimonadota bacterium]
MRSIAGLAAGSLLSLAFHDVPCAQQGAASVGGVAALVPIIGVWQSDTTDGVSARSNCVWTPEHGAVLCEQRIVTPSGAKSALSLFSFGSRSHKYVFYGLSDPGDPMRPVSLVIRGAIWIYGGDHKNDDGKFYRTVNDFSAHDHYTWRQESSVDGAIWVPGSGGSSRRVQR